MNSVSNDDTQAHPPTLVGATILQIVPALREDPVARTALDVVAALRQAGARALVAAEEGPACCKTHGIGGRMDSPRQCHRQSVPAQTQRRALQHLIASERIDIVHAQSAGGARIASLAAARIAVRLVTTLPDVPPAFGLRGYWAAALTAEIG